MDFRARCNDACREAAKVMASRHRQLSRHTVWVSWVGDGLLVDRERRRAVENVAMKLAGDRIFAMWHPGELRADGDGVAWREASPGYTPAVSYGVDAPDLLVFIRKGRLDFGEVDRSQGDCTRSFSVEDILAELTGIMASAMVPWMLRHCNRIQTTTVDFLAEMERLPGA